MIEFPALKTKIYNSLDCADKDAFERTDCFRQNEKIYIHSQINHKLVDSNFHKGKKQIVYFVDPIFGVKIRYVASSFIKFSVFGSARDISQEPIYKLNMGDSLNFELPDENLKFELSLTKNVQSILKLLQIEE